MPPIAGHVRIHYGSNDPNLWLNVTVAEAEDVPAPEDAVLVDLNRDGWLDIIAAAERSHLIYLQTPQQHAQFTVVAIDFAATRTRVPTFGYSQQI